MRLDKIYTRTGDRGKTCLVGGERVEKSSLRIGAMGAIDELNSAIGVVRTYGEGAPDADVVAECIDTLKQVQNDLFDCGCELGLGPGGMPDADVPRLTGEQVTFLESCIDRYGEILEPLPSFVLPGGGALNAHAHVARSVCRRAERRLWELNATEPVPENILKYVNRLSDVLFSLARWFARKAGEEEFLWAKGAEKPTGG